MRMNDTYQDALNGTLVSVDGGRRTAMTATNATPVHLLVYWVGLDGLLYGRNPRTGKLAAGYPGQVLEPGATITWTTVDPADCFVAKVGYSGAFVTAWRAGEANAAVTITDRELLDPDDIGETPVPTGSVLVPPNGPRVLVGAGVLPNGNSVTREQFWQRLPESYSLAAGEEKTVNHTQTQGMQETSSDSKTVSASVSASASAGWGPFSASVNASLSTSSTKSQQVSVSTQTTGFTSNQYTNDTSHGWMCLFWQLMDTLTVFDGTGTPVASVVSAKGPSVVWGPVDVDKLVDGEPADDAPNAGASNAGASNAGALNAGAALRDDVPEIVAVRAAAEPVRSPGPGRSFPG
ncbi:hypothetical protein ACFVVX_09360 [Kitasatospora sp. NPDC058170]|uniref:hypothetical protein n=1 Tax=Kitasatospora sp. NPDC058170 TaxID=3346364 RepID=UPI0036D89D5C